MTEYTPGLVSVIVPVFNREYMVSKTLDSILLQIYPHVEIVVINDGSTDNSLLVLSEYAKRYPGKIIVIDQENAGQVRARNKGIEVARGEYIAFLDSDDTWVQDKLSQQIPLFEGKIGLTYSGVHEVDLNGRITSTVLPEVGIRGDIYRQLLIKNRMTGGSVVVTRRALNKVGVFDESFRAAENWDLWIRVSREFEVDYVDKPLVYYLKHPGNMSHDNLRMVQGAWNILQKHLPVIPENNNLKASYQEAYANYYYNMGVQYFGKYEFVKAREMFFQCWVYKPIYRDSLIRTCRTFLGEKFNSFLSVAMLKIKFFFISE